MKSFVLGLLLFSSIPAFASPLNGLNLKQLNQVIASLDQTQVMRNFTIKAVLDEQSLNLVKHEASADGRGPTGLRCVSSDPLFQNAKCKVVPYGWTDSPMPAEFLRTYGEYHVGPAGYKAICDTVPGRWGWEGNFHKETKPNYMGLNCVKIGHEGH